MLRPAEFRRVFQQPIRSGDKSFRILARPNGQANHRLGMAVAKKACPKAVGRNRIKRQIRESFRAQMAAATPTEALDIVVLPTPMAASLSNQALAQSLGAHWQKLSNKAAGRSKFPGKPTKDTR